MAKYYIDFDTLEMKPHIKAVAVTLGHELITDMKAELPINLVDDPLYPKLVQYVWANDPGKYLRQIQSKKVKP